ncbi:TPA: GNAT family N-acetyltransferase [Providencia alcalifaciens]
MTHNEVCFYSLEDIFWSAICLKTHHVEPNTLAYFTELKTPAFNYIYLRSGATTTGFEAANTLFQQQSKPYILVVHTDELPKFSNYIQKYGLIDDGESTAMVFELTENESKTENRLPDGYHIKLSNHNLSDWSKPLITAFPVVNELDNDNDESIIDEYIRYHQRALDKKINIMHFVLFNQQAPVSSLTLTLHNDIARLDDIGTDIEFQRQGFATALIKHVLQICHQHKIKQCYLEASSDGLSVYQKLGFKSIFKYHSYISE